MKKYSHVVLSLDFVLTIAFVIGFTASTLVLLNTLSQTKTLVKAAILVAENQK